MPHGHGAWGRTRDLGAEAMRRRRAALQHDVGCRARAPPRQRLASRMLQTLGARRGWKHSCPAPASQTAPAGFVRWLASVGPLQRRRSASPERTARPPRRPGARARGRGAGAAPALRSPWMMPRACRKAMPAAISAAVASTMARSHLPFRLDGCRRKAPRRMASCAPAAQGLGRRPGALQSTRRGGLFTESLPRCGGSGAERPPVQAPHAQAASKATTRPLRRPLRLSLRGSLRAGGPGSGARAARLQAAAVHELQQEPGVAVLGARGAPRLRLARGLARRALVRAVPRLDVLRRHLRGPDAVRGFKAGVGLAYG